MAIIHKIMGKLQRVYQEKDEMGFNDELDSYYFREGVMEPKSESKTQSEEEGDPESEVQTVSTTSNEEEYEILEREIGPRKIICPDCGGITLEGLEFCDKCGGELISRD